MSDEWSEVCRELFELLRLRSSPVAVKLVKSEEEIPEGVEKPKKRLTVCQMVNLARIHKRTLAATVDEIICAYAQSVLGFAEWPEDMLSGDRQAGRRTETKEAFKKIIEGIPKIRNGTFQAIVLSPLEDTPVEPDLILIFGNPAQIMRLIHASTWKNGERLHFSTAAEAGTCGEGIAATYLSNQPTISFPCYGTRRFGLAQDDELIMGIPITRLSEVLEGLRKTHEAGLQYPIKQNVENTPEPPSLYYIRREPYP